jgi:hypothetical protein
MTYIGGRRSILLRRFSNHPGPLPLPDPPPLELERPFGRRKYDSLRACLVDVENAVIWPRMDLEPAGLTEYRSRCPIDRGLVDDPDPLADDRDKDEGPETGQDVLEE